MQDRNQRLVITLSQLNTETEANTRTPHYIQRMQYADKKQPHFCLLDSGSLGHILLQTRNLWRIPGSKYRLGNWQVEKSERDAKNIKGLMMGRDIHTPPPSVYYSH